jgi:hypothetical protein
MQICPVNALQHNQLLGGAEMVTGGSHEICLGIIL